MSATGVFRHTRLRARDGEDIVASGWVVDVTKTQLIADLSHGEQMQVGQQLTVEIFGAKYDLHADATFKAYVQDRALFGLENVDVKPASEAVRMAVPFYQCEVVWQGLKGEASAVDISMQGIGLLTSARLETDAILELTVNSPEGEIRMQADVRYCYPTDPDHFEFRAGARLTFTDRICQARWMRLFANQLAA